MTSTPPEFRKITALVKFAAAIGENEVRGVKDTPFKIWACYLAKKLTQYNNVTIAGYFQIDPVYMQNRLQDYQIGFLINDTAQQLLTNIETAYHEIEAANETL